MIIELNTKDILPKQVPFGQCVMFNGWPYMRIRFELSMLPHADRDTPYFVNLHDGRVTQLKADTPFDSKTLKVVEA